MTLPFRCLNWLLLVFTAVSALDRWHNQTINTLYVDIGTSCIRIAHHGVADTLCTRRWIRDFSMVLRIFFACHFGSHGYPCHISTVFDYRRTGSDSAWVMQTLSVKLTYPCPLTPQAVCFNLVSGFILLLSTFILLFAMFWHCQNEFAPMFYITGLLGLIASILHIVNGFMCLHYMPGEEAYVLVRPL